MKGFFFTCIVFLGLISCRESQKTMPYVVIDLEKALNNNVTEDITLEDFADIVRIIPIETNDSILLQFMNIAGVTEHQIVVYDKNGLYFINKEDGKASFYLNRQGRGEGEYTSLSNACINERDSMINLFELETGTISKYTFDGRFTESVKNDQIGEYIELDDGNFAAYFPSYSKTDDRLGIYDKSWNLKRSAISRVAGPRLAMIYLDQLVKCNGKYYYKAALADTVYQITSESETPYMVISKGKYKMPLEVLTTLDKMDKESFHYIKDSGGYMASKYFFLVYNYNRKQYYDIWDMENSSLIYRSKYGQQVGIDGIPVTVNGVQVNTWPRYVSGDTIYCFIEAVDARRIIPPLPEDTNPVILELKIKK